MEQKKIDMVSGEKGFSSKAGLREMALKPE